MNSFFKVITLCAIILLSVPAIAQDKLDIFQVFHQFLLANHAASKCIKPDREILGKFLGNFQVVWIRSAMEIQKRDPKHTKEEIERFMKAKSDLQDQRVKEIIQSNGCNDPRIQDLIKRFYIQANLQLGK